MLLVLKPSISNTKNASSVTNYLLPFYILWENMTTQQQRSVCRQPTTARCHFLALGTMCRRENASNTWSRAVANHYGCLPEVLTCMLSESTRRSLCRQLLPLTLLQQAQPLVCLAAYIEFVPMEAYCMLLRGKNNHITDVPPFTATSFSENSPSVQCLQKW